MKAGNLAKATVLLEKYSMVKKTIAVLENCGSDNYAVIDHN
jgi:hypothetical protein